MPLKIYHAKTLAQADGADTTVVRPIDWNTDLVTSMATARLLGRTTAAAGAIEEIAASNGLSLTALSLGLNPSAVWLEGLQGTATATAGLVQGANLTTTMTQVSTTVAAGKVQQVRVRVANQLASPGGATCDVIVTNGTLTYYLAMGLAIPLGTAQDIIEGLYLPAGWRVSALANMDGALSLVVTGLEATAPTTPAALGLLFGSNLTTTLGTIGTAVAANRIQKLKVRATNTGLLAAAADLAINNGATTLYLATGIMIAPGTAQDLCDDLILPAPWRIQGRASAAANIDMVATGQETAA